MKSQTGMNAGVYHNSGYNGEAYAGAGGRIMRIGMLWGSGYFNHPGFVDSPGNHSRAIPYDCSQSPCVANQDGPGLSEHDLHCAGLAAGSIRQHQIAGYTNLEELERSGVAEEPDLYFLDGTDLTRSIEQAIELELDVVFISAGNDVPCDGQAGSSADAALEAIGQNILLVKSAGNNGHSGECSLSHPADVPPFFIVGGLGPTCLDSNYSTCPMWDGSSRGGVDATIAGTTSPQALSAVDVVAPACPQFTYTPDANPISSKANPTCGTSFSTPQVAGAAILMKDYFLEKGLPFIADAGAPFVVLLAMTDRQSESGKRTNGFDPIWGGGRFQMRRFDASDHAGVWGWEHYWITFNSPGIVNHNLWGSTAEPASLQQVKVYTRFFEERDALDIARINLAIRTQNCSSADVVVDSSDDIKKMVRMGATAGGQQLCARVRAQNLPGASRRSHVFAYYSAATGMR